MAREEGRKPLAPVDVQIEGDQPVDSGLLGKVYIGRQNHLDRKVAVKLVPEEMNPDAVDHAIALAKVNHPNVVTVHSVGMIPEPITGELISCIVLEWLEGKKLYEAWEELDPDDIPRVCHSMIEGMRAIHKADVCHHDFHAGNVMVSPEVVKIIDIHYTQSVRFSRLSTTPKDELVSSDCSALSQVCRNLLWKVNGSVDPDIEAALLRARSLDEIESILATLWASPAATAAGVQISAIVQNEYGLSMLDAEVLRAAGDMLVKAERFDSWISVPQIVETINKEGTLDSVRLLIEQGYFVNRYIDNPRALLFTQGGFDQYVKAFRSSYGQEFRQICVEVVRSRQGTDIELSALCEIPRAVVENVLHELAADERITAKKYNAHTQYQSVSLTLQRQVEGLNIPINDGHH